MNREALLVALIVALAPELYASLKRASERSLKDIQKKEILKFENEQKSQRKRG